VGVLEINIEMLVFPINIRIMRALKKQKAN